MMKLNKKASSYWFIYVASFAFVLIIMYIIFNETLQVYMYPTTQYLTNGSTIGTSRADTFLGFWQLVPFILIIISLFYLFIKSVSKEDNSVQ